MLIDPLIVSLLLVGDKFQEDGGGICFFHSSFLSIRNVAFHIVGTQSRTVDWINKGVSFIYPDIIKLLTSGVKNTLFPFYRIVK